MAPRLLKYLQLLVNRRYWPALRHGVAATVEHDAALGQDDFATVIDVGANKGQFATYALTRWPRARLICFEPLPQPRAILGCVTQGRAEIHACALGATGTTGQLHLATRADSSSLLPLGTQQKAIFQMDECGTLAVPIERLDACLSVPLQRPSLLKIDVQGYELEVLRGAAGLLDEIDAIYVEVSYAELYEGQALHDDVATFLTSAGFRDAGHFNEQVYHGARIQADLLFRRQAVVQASGMSVR
ncbi:FkbM family methyltransferase [uncultured Thiodictyon sp.]|uniref:FkbM family methyltransferase n=1 Tax=uncultured Thiodictyon sp. TaxID=1846217 RepID=UPI0025E1A15F|nr:FkbM family methyltransferase [uncultured Thiodictyon sp.]